jgi:UDP-N-acetylmuramoyl-L-alanyl-D-glutamate--2,6-diaminopimelate ligase
VLDELGRHAEPRGGALIVVFGSAGERDVAKRSEMGRIAGERCRLVVLTDEDPRGEDREAVLAEIAAGATAAGKRRGVDLLLIPDRRTAIRTALGAARPGDFVLLAGKGHETTILYADHAEPWDERAEAVAALADLGYRGPGAG